MFQEKALKRGKPFQIVVGLVERFGNHQRHTLPYVQKIIGAWATERMNTGAATISGGLLTEGVDIAVYHDEKLGARVDNRLVAIFSGQLDPCDYAAFSPKLAAELLRSLSQTLGERLKQEGVTVTYGQKTRVYQNIFFKERAA